MRRLESVLVANRGEIAVRILRTCRRLGLRTVAVYSDADARALHVSEADQAVRIGPSPAADSYLNQAAILQAARQTGAAAIHPGYGFLAENADFAQNVIDAGLVWIGPPAAAMRALGDKARAKALAAAHQVPLLPGYHGENQSPQILHEHADRIGYPVLIKASAGGGGRGMRVVDSTGHFDDALQAAKREATASFGSDRVLLERYVARPRHIEVQIVGDRHGNLIHLGERECSIQRRYQKLIEESPSPAVDAELRARMGEAALRLARAAGYSNTGTIEFLLDQEAGKFAFLEVNTRLQVEHPVTEAITGLDLVDLQLQIAAGEPLPLAQPEVCFDGHAIEARVIAEDALAGFLPSSGRVRRFRHPEFVRVDTWVQDGTVVSPYYDSLLAKVIAHGPTRADSTSKLARALREIEIDGVQHNVDLLLATVESSEFQLGHLDTRFLEEHRIVEALAEVPPSVLAAVSALDHLRPPRNSDPWHAGTGWRLGRFDQPAVWIRAGRPHTAHVSADLRGDGVIVEVEGVGAQVRHLHRESDSRYRVNVDGRRVIVTDVDSGRLAEYQNRGYRLERARPLSLEETAHDRGAAGAAGSLTAPMPGRVVKIAVETGQEVAQNQPLVVLEAMKMEHVVEAPHSGVVTDLSVEVGEQVASGARLLTIE
jgi:3-methylcrotonyl-CoA carboxylase alpha subunit